MRSVAVSIEPVNTGESQKPPVLPNRYEPCALWITSGTESSLPRDNGRAALSPRLLHGPAPCVLRNLPPTVASSILYERARQRIDQSTPQALVGSGADLAGLPSAFE